MHFRLWMIPIIALAALFFWGWIREMWSAAVLLNAIRSSPSPVLTHDAWKRSGLSVRHFQQGLECLQRRGRLRVTYRVHERYRHWVELR